MDRNVLFALAVALLLAGCLGNGREPADVGDASTAPATAPSATDEPLGPSGPFHGPPRTPLLVNASGYGTIHLTVTKLHEEDCAAPIAALPQDLGILVYDRDGLAYERIERLDASFAERTIELELTGPGPHILAGGRHPCGYLYETNVTGVTDGWLLDVPHDRPATMPRYYDDAVVRMEVTVAAAKHKGSDTWEPAASEWFVVQAFVDGTNTTDFHGTVRLTDPQGDVAREHRYAAAGDSLRRGPLTRMEGTYRLDVELSEPRVAETRVSYGIQLLRWQEPVCGLGLQWPMCA